MPHFMTDKQDNKEEGRQICSICHGDYYGNGNNAYPVTEGRCCDACNDIVIRARINDRIRERAL